MTQSDSTRNQQLSLPYLQLCLQRHPTSDVPIKLPAPRSFPKRTAISLLVCLDLGWYIATSGLNDQAYPGTLRFAIEEVLGLAVQLQKENVFGEGRWERDGGVGTQN